MIETFEDVIDAKLADEIENFIFSQEMLWNFEKTTVDLSFNLNDDNIVEHIQFRSIIKHGINVSNQLANSYVNKILFRLAKKHNIFVEDCFRIKSNLLPKIEKYKELQYNTPHVDADIDHYVLLYYVNDCDGDTIIFDQTKKDYPMEEAKSFNSFQVKQTIKPKKGKLVLFDGDYYHTSSHPVNSAYRCVINIDSEKKFVNML